MNWFVGYFEIVSLRPKLEEGGENVIVEDAFVKPLAYFSNKYPEILIEAFPESVVIAAKESDVESLLKGIRSLFTSWSTDYILAHGGLCYGMLQQISDPFKKDLHRHLNKVLMHRIIGPALQLAFQTALNGSPGMLCELHQTAVRRIREIDPSVIYGSSPSFLIWLKQSRLETFQHMFRLMLLDNEVCDHVTEPVILGTIEFLENIQSSGES